MRPERRLKPGVDGGLRAASWISPPHHLRTREILSKRWGPPHVGRGLAQLAGGQCPERRRLELFLNLVEQCRRVLNTPGVALSTVVVALARVPIDGKQIADE